MDFADLISVPERLTTPEFVLRPLVAADVELDFDAVMASRDQLRPWEQSGWPADDFTIEENLSDIEEMERGHRAGRRFTYTVMTPDESECLGCVYFMPGDARSYVTAEITPLAGGGWDRVRGTVSFWVRTSRLDDGLDRRLLSALLRWIEEDWGLHDLVVMTNEEVPQQVAVLERAGLRPVFRVHQPGQSGAYLAYAEVP
ncbi:GNAT family N-acetyltransferase [Microbacterium sp. RU33B]|uniref:GNAT family N-acetyltransferase n=1 Tax=Microbacterium sp. RU33B TaxID=1907390 RepID=UPI000964EE21|nr:GNAT family protein [Microbacterium sp. RU33B]SIT84042.1 Protein N-acetyltransferase, RimJ/RimL family [Microbacterium sp. RU33B]